MVSVLGKSKKVPISAFWAVWIYNKVKFRGISWEYGLNIASYYSFYSTHPSGFDGSDWEKGVISYAQTLET